MPNARLPQWIHVKGSRSRGGYLARENPYQWSPPSRGRRDKTFDPLHRTGRLLDLPTARRDKQLGEATLRPSRATSALWSSLTVPGPRQPRTTSRACRCWGFFQKAGDGQFKVLLPQQKKALPAL
jgi:hypothetical protein